MTVHVPVRRNSLTAGQLAKPVPYLVLVATLLAAAGVVALASETFSIGLTVVFGVGLFMLVMFLLSLSVEGPRKAKDLSLIHI